MVRLNRIYTKTGDDGSTGLGDGSRLPKHHLRIAAYGTVDEVGSLLGLVLAHGADEALATTLRKIQNDLFDVGADLSVPGEAGEKLRVTPAYTEQLEALIDSSNEDLAPLKSFVLAGGRPIAAWLHLARTVCRRAERLVSELASFPEEAGRVNPEVLRYLNRLSDLLFVQARAANDQGAADVLWKPGETQAGGRVIELGWITPAVWAERALEQPLELLSDHAHCELGAASSAQAMIVKNPGRTRFAQRLGALAIEELNHFRQVVALLDELGGAVGQALPNPYMEGLLRSSAPTRTVGFLDRLLVAALIERRSLERFEMLAEAAEDPRIADLYADLGPSERGHGLLFVDLAHEAYPDLDVDRRLDDLITIEAEVMAGLAFDVRIHSGTPAVLPTSVS